MLQNSPICNATVFVLKGMDVLRAVGRENDRRGKERDLQAKGNARGLVLKMPIKTLQADCV